MNNYTIYSKGPDADALLLEKSLGYSLEHMAEGIGVDHNIGFKDGIDWVSKLPISKRLSDDEIKKIKALHYIVKEWAEVSENEELKSIYQSLEYIFGSEMFNNLE